MDSWTARKRPREDDSPIDVRLRHRDSPSEHSAPPLPQAADYHRRDSQALSPRRLPPLYTSTCMAPAAPHTSVSSQRSPLAYEAGEEGSARPRSQSLFDVSQPPKRLRRDSTSESSTTFPGALDLDRPLPSIDASVSHPHFGTDPTHSCCPSDCEGQTCSTARTLMRRLASELILLEIKPPEIEHVGTRESLQWALDFVQWTNMKFRNHVEIKIPRSPEQSSVQLEALSNMRRGQHHLEKSEEQSPPARHFPDPQHLQYPQHPQHAQSHPRGYSGFTHPSAMNEDNRRIPYANDVMPMANSPHHTASSPGSIFMPPQSPIHALQPSRQGMLPSPSSMNFPNAPNLPPMSPPSTSLHASPQAAHLQDLQHQVSIKTLAFQTLQREYDSLLHKLERQRTKCATLEKKFEVSDVEINSLMDDKEKLQAQVAVLENQAEDLQQSRDEARRQLIANGTQYMRIMDMANRLQAQGADDKKQWETERSELEQRIKILEEAMVTGTERPAGEAGHDSSASPPSIILSHNPHLVSATPTSSAETINVLRVEIGRLRTRTQILEAALQTTREESISIQAAARQLVEFGGKIETAAHGAMGG
ncbi:hypothetical protein K504DRAFT_275981 [Pleomassaria siparia CBS 279.74]|uniref:Uncharacterized protein n=1 Tax=Pleomassaria siparia CBS 279.74 TaxID=1314801 RepID=A0A6G1K9C5_9PLEO|nr:hypothetical protein K504DRAFT_275981 [Pleomassaria siparia CBS 279.74]